ncbi:unnamed protein product [Bemisia tabaci]|uniref:Kinase n=1 Tax=Bemisia tabaci TaxID=7038 RepID=A0A9P0AML2_BEMTA|nr:unnamed protein product [Bemisia tabaci]
MEYFDSVTRAYVSKIPLQESLTPRVQFQPFQFQCKQFMALWIKCNLKISNLFFLKQENVSYLLRSLENERGSMERTSNVLSRLSKKSSESNDVQLAWSSTESHPEWFQLSGHPDCFAVAGPGTIWKKCSDSTERDVYEALSKEPTLKNVIPRHLRTVEHDGQTFIELQDLLDGFEDPQVMDIKLGVRTFLESEVQNTTARQDLYKKMVAIDPDAPTEEEKQLQAVTKLRYMQFRENQSSTCSQGFRIEAIKLSGEPPRSNLQRVKSIEDVQNTLKLFLQEKEKARSQLVTILRNIRNKLEQTQYFKTHEVVGSSILIIHDNSKVGAWLIDFGKTRPVPDGLSVNHRTPWTPGNHEEGLLIGLDNLINIIENLKLKEVAVQVYD